MSKLKIYTLIKRLKKYLKILMTGDWLMKLYVTWNYHLIFSLAIFFFNEHENF